MQNHKLVLPEHLNHYGYLFGGNLLKWVDECCWIAASLDYPGCILVTVGMDKVEFKKSIRQGTILIIQVDRAQTGRTSVHYAVRVLRNLPNGGPQEEVFSTRVTLVRVDDTGAKTPLPV